MKELSVEVLVEQVVARNPSLEAMRAAWQAAEARVPQVTSLDDPMVGATIGPATFGSNTLDAAFRVEIAQKYPWFGKRRLRGDHARAEARAAGNDVDDLRLALIEQAKDAFFEFYLVDRALDVNTESLRLLQEFRQNAQARFKVGGSLQDALQADVEIGREAKQRLTLERMRQVVVARINRLLHRAPEAALPPPPVKLALAASLPDVAALRSAAIAQRPDVQALEYRVGADEAAVALALKEFYPDLEPFFMWDQFMGNTPEMRQLAAMLGVKFNLPVRRERRVAAVAEAQAKLAQRQADLTRVVDQVGFEVQQAYAQTQESEKAVGLYEKTILPAAQTNVKTAQSEYVTGKIPFLSLLAAQRSVIEHRNAYYETLADYHRRRAVLERATGGMVLGEPARNDD